MGYLWNALCDLWDGYIGCIIIQLDNVLVTYASPKPLPQPVQIYSECKSTVLSGRNYLSMCYKYK